MSMTVTLQPSGRSFSTQRDEPVLAAALRAGVGLPYVCKDGGCGSCKCRLIEGRVIHGARDSQECIHLSTGRQRVPVRDERTGEHSAPRLVLL